MVNGADVRLKHSYMAFTTKPDMKWRYWQIVYFFNVALNNGNGVSKKWPPIVIKSLIGKGLITEASQGIYRALDPMEIVRNKE